MKWPKDFVGKVIHGDCLDVMRKMPDKCVDLIFTDPPYGVKRDKGFTGRGLAPRRQYSDSWDSMIPSEDIFKEIFRISKNQIFFGGNFFWFFRCYLFGCHFFWGCFSSSRLTGCQDQTSDQQHSK